MATLKTMSVPQLQDPTTFANPDLAMIGAAYGFEVTRILSRDELAALPAILARPGPQFVIIETSLDAVRPKA